MERISVTKFLRQYPEYQRRYENQNWSINTVGNAYDYDDSVCQGHLYAYYGVFMELFIRKCLCTRFGIDCIDKRTINILSHNRIRNRSLKHDITCAYAAYCHPQTRAIDIIDDIKLVALSNRLIHRGELEDLDDIDNMNVNFANLKEIVQFLNRLPYGDVVYKEPCDFEFDLYTLRGVPDFIFDDNVFCQISTSMYAGTYKKKIGKIALYILSHYERNYYENEEDNEYEIMIYNPLLNQTYTTYIDMSPWVFEKLHGQIESDMENLMDNVFYHKYVKNL